MTQAGHEKRAQIPRRSERKKEEEELSRKKERIDESMLNQSLPTRKLI